MSPSIKQHHGANTAPKSYSTGIQLRLAARNGEHQGITSGQATSYLQASPVILPSRYARDFELLCARNPVPCPLLAQVPRAGVFDQVKSNIPGVSNGQMAKDLDLRRDTPRYMVFQDGRLVKRGCTDIMEEWSEDHVTFLIGCSYSFENALSAAGLPPRHNVMDYNCPMYLTNVPLNPAGVFVGSTYVVSMRTYNKKDIPRVIEITRPFVFAHGEPIAWGWEAFGRLGIRDVDEPEWGDPPLTEDGRSLSSALGDEENVPVFWGCGVTPQAAVEAAKLPGVIMCHCPGHILVLDVQDSAVVDKSLP